MSTAVLLVDVINHLTAVMTEHESSMQKLLLQPCTLCDSEIHEKCFSMKELFNNAGNPVEER